MSTALRSFPSRTSRVPRSDLTWAVWGEGEVNLTAGTDIGVCRTKHLEKQSWSLMCMTVSICNSQLFEQLGLPCSEVPRIKLH